jgi:Fe-S cluster assembly protein SufD
MIDKLIQLYNVNLESLEDLLPLGKIRTQGIKDFTRLGFPIVKMEKWKNFNLKELKTNFFDIDLTESPNSLDVLSSLNGFKSQDSIIFYNGFCSYEMQLEEYENGIIFGSIRAAIKKYPDLVFKYLNKANKQNLNGLNGLNSALAVDGFFLYVPKGIKSKLPFTIVNHFSDENKKMVNFRNIVVLEEGASAEIIRIEYSTDNDKQFVNNLSEVFIDKDSKLDWNSKQNYNGNTTIVNPMFIHQQENSNMVKNIGIIGGNKLRNDIHLKLNGKYCYTDINGMYILNNHDLVDNSVYIDHAVSDCDSNQLFKGVLDGFSRGAFTGYVLVRQDSQRTNAFQSNKNIVISDNAKINTNPFLEIYADDVKCSHGATVGSLDENALFYLKSRGIDEKKAKEILLSAFAIDALIKIKNKEFKAIIISEMNEALSNLV